MPTVPTFQVGRTLNRIFPPSADKEQLASAMLAHLGLAFPISSMIQNSMPFQATGGAITCKGKSMMKLEDSVTRMVYNQHVHYSQVHTQAPLGPPKTPGLHSP